MGSVFLTILRFVGNRMVFTGAYFSYVADILYIQPIFFYCSCTLMNISNERFKGNITDK